MQAVKISTTIEWVFSEESFDDENVFNLFVRHCSDPKDLEVMVKGFLMKNVNLKDKTKPGDGQPQLVSVSAKPFTI